MAIDSRIVNAIPGSFTFCLSKDLCAVPVEGVTVGVCMFSGKRSGIMSFYSVLVFC